MENSQSLVVDLGLSDTEYLTLLAEGRDPVREQRYVSELTSYGCDRTLAQQAAPLFDKLGCSIEEKILTHQVLHWLWKQLTR